MMRTLFDNRIYPNTEGLRNVIRLLGGTSEPIRKLNVEAISSTLEQKEREDVLGRFRSKKTRILVATDVISRGIDGIDPRPYSVLYTHAAGGTR